MEYALPFFKLVVPTCNTVVTSLDVSKILKYITQSKIHDYNPRFVQPLKHNSTPLETSSTII